jgi:hypothetical protein
MNNDWQLATYIVIACLVIQGFTFTYWIRKIRSENRQREILICDLKLGMSHKPE